MICRGHSRLVKLNMQTNRTIQPNDALSASPRAPENHISEQPRQVRGTAAHRRRRVRTSAPTATGRVWSPSS
jgi:hypothetical protein